MDLVPIEMAFFFYEIDSSQFHNSIGYANVMIYVKSLSTLSMALKPLVLPPTVENLKKKTILSYFFRRRRVLALFQLVNCERAFQVRV